MSHYKANSIKEDKYEKRIDHSTLPAFSTPASGQSMKENFDYDWQFVYAGSKGDEKPTAYSSSQIFAQLCKANPQVMRGITAHALSRSLTALGILPRHTRKGNVYHLIPITTT